MAHLKEHLRDFIKRNPVTSPLYRVMFFLRYSDYFRRILRNFHRPSFWLRLWRWHSFDIRYGTDTQRPLEPHQYDLSKSELRDCTLYRGSNPELVQKILTALPIDVSQWVFLDVGSGKGRALLLASDFPFNCILGVEFSPQLHRVAEHNIQIYHSRQQRCFNIVSVCCDALTLDLPLANTIIYAFNPFGADSVAKFIDRLGNSLQQVPRRVIILFMTMTPSQHAVLTNSGFLRECTQEWLANAPERDLLQHHFHIWENL